MIIIIITSYEQYNAQPRIRPEEWDAKTSQGFWNTNRSPNLGQTTRPSDD